MKTGRLTLRPALPEDAGAVLDIYSHYINNTAITFEEAVPSIEQYRRRMADIMSEYPFLVCTDGGRIAGYAYAHRHQERAAYRYSAELSVYLRPHYTGLGIGRALCEALIGLLRLQNVQTVYSAISLPNDPSCALHEAMGFERVGLWKNTGRKQGRWIDIVWYELALGSYPDAPGPLVPFERVDTAAAAAVLTRCAALMDSRSAQ